MAVSLVFWLVKEVCEAAMKVFRGDRTTAVSMSESNTTRGNPPSRSLYTASELDHRPNFMNLATSHMRHRLVDSMKIE